MSRLNPETPGRTAAADFQPPACPVVGNVRELSREDRLAAMRTHYGALDRYKEVLERWEAALPQNVGLIFDHPDDVQIVTRNIGGGWRVTSISKIDHAPIRHATYSSRFAALWSEERGRTRLPCIPFPVEPRMPPPPSIFHDIPLP